jgi:8-oxo-dGTP pyrophosphatase MutT (NUDIX family)
MDREISAGLIVYRQTEEGPKFLLLYHGGHYWNFPKGKIEEEEKSLEAAIRETEEETGLGLKDLKIKRKFKAYERFTYFRHKKRIFKIVIFYLAETRKRQIVISREHEGFGWFLYKDARQLLKFYKDSETVLKRAYDFIRLAHPKPQPRSG